MEKAYIMDGRLYVGEPKEVEPELTGTFDGEVKETGYHGTFYDSKGNPYSVCNSGVIVWF